MSPVSLVRYTSLQLSTSLKLSTSSYGACLQRCPDALACGIASIIPQPPHHRQPTTQLNIFPTRARQRDRNLLPRLVIALATVGLFLISYQWGSQYRHGDARTPVLSGILIHPPQTLPDLVLKDSQGNPFGRTELSDRWSLIVFTNLGDESARRDIARLVEIHNRLADRPRLQRLLRLLLVSNDNMPKLAAELEGLLPIIDLLAAEASTLSNLRAALGTQSEREHEALPPLFLIDPKSRLLAFFPASQSAEQIATDIKALSDWPDPRTGGEHDR